MTGLSRYGFVVHAKINGESYIGSQYYVCTFLCFLKTLTKTVPFSCTNF